MRVRLKLWNRIYRTPTLLRMQGARIYDDVHVSGHLSQEEHYEMLDAL
jgi:ribonuclease J